MNNILDDMLAARMEHHIYYHKNQNTMSHLIIRPGDFVFLDENNELRRAPDYIDPTKVVGVALTDGRFTLKNDIKMPLYVSSAGINATRIVTEEGLGWEKKFPDLADEVKFMWEDDTPLEDKWYDYDDINHEEDDDPDWEDDEEDEDEEELGYDDTDDDGTEVDLDDEDEDEDLEIEF